MKRNLLYISLIWIISIPNLFSQTADPQLNALIQAGIEQSHSLKINRFETRKTQLDRKRAWQTFLPKIQLNTSYTRLDNDIVLDEDLQKLLMGTQSLLAKEALGLPFNAPLPPQVPLQPIPPVQEKNIYKSAVDAEWILFSGLKVTNTSKALKHKEKALSYKNEIIKKELVEKISKSYLQLGLINASFEVLKQSRKYLQKQNEYVTKAIQNGLTTDLDLQKIKLAEKELDLKELELNNNKKLAVLQLAQLTGKNKKELQNLRIPFRRWILDLAQLKKKERVELKALKEGIEAKKALKKAELSEYIPKIAAKAHYELTDRSLTMLDPKWYVGIGVKWNLFDGLQALNKSKKIHYEVEAQKEKLQETKELIALQQQQAFLNYEKALEEIGMRKQEVKLASETYEYSLKKYRNGLVSITEVLKDLNRLEKAELDLKKSIYRQNMATIALLNAYDGIVENLN